MSENKPSETAKKITDALTASFDIGHNSFSNRTEAWDWQEVSDDEIAAIISAALTPAPIPMILHCPNCHTQHIDAPEPGTDWNNPPHKSHKCRPQDGGCETVWSPLMFLLMAWLRFRRAVMLIRGCPVPRATRERNRVLMVTTGTSKIRMLKKLSLRFLGRNTLLDGSIKAHRWRD